MMLGHDAFIKTGILNRLLKFTLFCFSLVCPQMGFTQAETVVFQDDFNRGNESFLAGEPDSSGKWTTAVGGDTSWNVGIDSEELVISQSGNNALGHASVSTPTSLWSVPFQTELASNVGPVSWYFNIQKTGAVDRSAAAFILGATGSDFQTGTHGYAVIINASSASAGLLELVRFSDGLGLSNSGGFSNYTTLISSSLGNPVGFPDNTMVSARATFDPATGEWGLYGRNDGTTSFQNPLTLDDTYFRGNEIEPSLLGDSLNYSGFYHTAFTFEANLARFDNITISVIPEPRTYAIFGLGFIGLLLAVRRLDLGFVTAKKRVSSE